MCRRCVNSCSSCSIIKICINKSLYLKFLLDTDGISVPVMHLKGGEIGYDTMQVLGINSDMETVFLI